MPFTTSRDARTSKNDPRPSLEERYDSHAAYTKLVTGAAEKLVASRLLLPEDAQRFAERANSEEIRKKFNQ